MPLVTGPDLAPGAVVDRRPAGKGRWDFTDRRIEAVTFRGIRDGEEWLQFRRCLLVDCTFVDSLLQWSWGVDHERQEDACRFERCRFVRSPMRPFRIAYGRLEGCTFEQCDWNTVHLRAVDLVDNVFVGVVEGLTVWGRDIPIMDLIVPRPRPNEIHGNDFRAADLRGLALRAEVPTREQLWPEGAACAVVDRLPDRLAAVLARSAADGDAPDAELSETARGRQAWITPGAEQSVAWLRWDDPSMPAASNRLARALAEVDPG